MKRKFKVLLSALLACAILVGCGDVTIGDRVDTMSEADAKKELNALLSGIDEDRIHIVSDPQLDIYMDDIMAEAVGSIDGFPIVVQGNGQINIEIAGATELTSDSPDDWLIIVARNFNKSGAKLNGKTVSVTVRQITSGEIVTYMTAADYKPNATIMSNAIWDKMLTAKGIGCTTIVDRVAGNTAGILLSQDAYDAVQNTYGEVTIGTVLTAGTNKDIVFAYPNPYTSSTGVNGVSAMLKFFDPSDPLSSKASQALFDYQKTAPPVAYTTAVLRNQASKGIIDAMLMEEQAYINTPSLSEYVYIPFGVRHDHPVVSFDWNTDEQNEAVKLFADFCLNTQSQNLATEKGFNRHDDYKSQDPGLTGQGYLTAQSIWKENKNGGKPVVAVFVTDISGSMRGERIAALQRSLIQTLPYIGSEHYVGLVSYSTDITINLPIAEFDDKQRAYFSGEIKNLNVTGGTSTYDAVLVGLDMIVKKMEEIPDATPILFLLTDGEVNSGYRLSRILPVVGGLNIPVYTIAYHYENMEELEELSEVNEASTTRADSQTITDHLRNLFNTQL